VKVIALGVHVVDVLARPVEAIPEGQGGTLVEEIRITPAGSAGGTAVVLAKLGADVRSAGAIGTDALGDVLLDLLGRYEVETSLLVRREGVQTSASVFRSGPTARAPRCTSSAPTARTRPPTRRGTRSPRPRSSTSAPRSSWAARRRPPFSGTRANTT
jgi:sugar/nucleoside kinase (ribokinase family)